MYCIEFHVLSSDDFGGGADTHTPLILYKLPEALVFQNGFSYRQTVSLIPTEQQNLKRKGTERKCKKSERKKRKVYFYSRFVVLILFISNSSRVAASNCE